MITYDAVGAGPITIGGGTSNPFPKYSINREVIRASDGTPIANKYTISVIGQVLATGDITTTGARQNALQSSIISNLLSADLTKDQGVGTLTIEPYGGLANKIVFLDASLLAVSVPEQTDESAGVQFQDYTFEFEANVSTSIGGTADPFPYRLASAEESWDLVENEGDMGFDSNDITGNPLKSYLVTHTVSAIGLKSFGSGPTLDGTSGPAWTQAKNWCESRLKSPSNDVDTDVSGTSQKVFKPDEDMIAVITSYQYFNNNRVASIDYAGGSYTITETWFASESGATHDIEVSMDTDEESVTSVTVTGAIKGQSSSGYSSNAKNSLTQAEAALEATLSYTYTLANSLYEDSIVGPGTGDDDKTLNTVVKTQSISKNKITGVISYSRTYNDKDPAVDDAISDSVSITDNNKDQSTNTVAILAIIGRSEGPIIQDMGTTPERSRGISIDATMKKEKRDNMPSTLVGDPGYNEGLATTIATWIPDVAVYPNVSQQSKNETWDPVEGTYSLQIDWVY